MSDDKDEWDKCSGLVHWEDPEGSGREEGGRGDRDGEYRTIKKAERRRLNASEL